MPRPFPRGGPKIPTFSRNETVWCRRQPMLSVGESESIVAHPLPNPLNTFHPCVYSQHLIKGIGTVLYTVTMLSEAASYLPSLQARMRLTASGCMYCSIEAGGSECTVMPCTVTESACSANPWCGHRAPPYSSSPTAPGSEFQIFGSNFED